MTTARHPAYRSRYLPAMTRAQLDALPGKATAVVIVPTGAVEQHGPHLPTGVDAIVGQGLLVAAFAHLSAHAPVYVAPAITYGLSIEHVGFPGTVTVSAMTLHRLLKATAGQLQALGFRTLAVLNTHGGNSAVLVPTLREIQMELGLNAGRLTWKAKAPLSKQEAAWGFHAGQWETSLMLALAPHLVDMKRAVREHPARIDDPGELRPVKSTGTFAWLASDVSRSGVMGDAKAALATDGKAWIAASGRVLAAQLQAMVAKLARS